MSNPQLKELLDGSNISPLGSNVEGYNICKYGRAALCVSTIVLANAGGKDYIALCRKPVDFNEPQGELRPYEIPGGHLMIRALPGAQDMTAPYDKDFLDAGLRKIKHETSLVIPKEDCTHIEAYYWSTADFSGVTDISVYHCGDFASPKDLPALSAKDNELAVVEWVCVNDMTVNQSIPGNVKPHTQESFAELQHGTGRYKVEKADGSTLLIIDEYGAILDRTMKEWRHKKLERDFGVTYATITNRVPDAESSLGTEAEVVYEQQRDFGNKCKNALANV